MRLRFYLQPQLRPRMVVAVYGSPAFYSYTLSEKNTRFNALKHTMPTLKDLGKESFFLYYVGKGKNACKQHFLLF